MERERSHNGALACLRAPESTVFPVQTPPNPNPNPNPKPNPNPMIFDS